MEDLIRWLVEEAAAADAVAGDMSSSDACSLAYSHRADAYEDVLNWIGTYGRQ